MSTPPAAIRRDKLTITNPDGNQLAAAVERPDGTPLDGVEVRLRHHKIHARHCETCETEEGRVDHIERVITLHRGLDDEARARLLAIADRCPVHRTLHSEIAIDTRPG